MGKVPQQRPRWWWWLSDLCIRVGLLDQRKVQLCAAVATELL